MEISAEACDNATKRSGILSNILEHLIKGLNIVAVLHQDLIPKNRLCGNQEVGQVSLL